MSNCDCLEGQPAENSILEPEKIERLRQLRTEWSMDKSYQHDCLYVRSLNQHIETASRIATETVGAMFGNDSAAASRWSATFHREMDTWAYAQGLRAQGWQLGR